METFGRTLYFGRFDFGEDFVPSLDSVAAGDVSLLEIGESEDDGGDVSVTIEEGMESRRLSGLRCRLACDIGLNTGADLRRSVAVRLVFWNAQIFVYRMWYGLMVGKIYLHNYAIKVPIV